MLLNRVELEEKEIYYRLRNIGPATAGSAGPVPAPLTCRVENILSFVKLLSLWFCFLLHVFDISNLLSYIQNNFKL